jgi:hypothetical protein
MSGKGNGLLIYKLYAVVVHVDMLNASLFFFFFFLWHYVCYAKDLHGSWYRIVLGNLTSSHELRNMQKSDLTTGSL